MKRKRATAFTLVELLVVMAIIGTLLAILVPAVNAVRAGARLTQCQNNLRQVGLAIHNFESAQQKFPPGQTWTAKRTKPGAIDYAWSALVLPYLEESSVFDQLDLSKSYLHASNLGAAAQVVPIYLCPSTSFRQEERIENQIQSAVTRGCIDYLGMLETINLKH